MYIHTHTHVYMHTHSHSHIHTIHTFTHTYVCLMPIVLTISPPLYFPIYNYTHSVCYQKAISYYASS